MRKFLSIFLVFALMLSLPMTVFAEDVSELPGGIDKGYKEYLKLVDDGVLGEDVTYEYWCDFLKQSALLEKKIEQTSDFHLVAELNSEDIARPNLLISGSIWNFVSLQPGDILITNGTSSWGIFGHAAIALSRTEILHIAGPGKNPEVISPSKWEELYESKGWTRIYRHSNSSTARSAASWASSTYRNSSAKYQITMNLASTDVTYCSKLVWQAYRYGPSKSQCNTGITSPVLILPFGLPDEIKNISLIMTSE